jgi:hypothetical protein
VWLCASGCGIDQAATAENLISDLAAARGESLSDGQEECLRTLIEAYTDADLEALRTAQADRSNPLTAAHLRRVEACVAPEVAPATTTP